MWSGDISPLAAARHQAWLYRQAASALRAHGDELLAKEFDAMANDAEHEASRWDHNLPSLYRLLTEPESLQ